MGFEILNVSRPSRVGEGRVGDRPLDFSVSRYLDLRTRFWLMLLACSLGANFSVSRD
jgi:hypothetical protein